MDTLPHLPLVEPPPQSAATTNALIALRERLALHLVRFESASVAELAALAGVPDNGALARALDYFWFKRRRASNTVALAEAGKRAAAELAGDGLCDDDGDVIDLDQRWTLAGAGEE